MRSNIMLHNNITDEELTTQTQGNEINLYNRNLTDKDVIQMIVPYLQQHPEITVVNLSVNNIGDPGAEALAETSITNLDVSDNKIGDKGAKALARGNLTELAITQNRVGDEGIAALAFAVKDKIYSLNKLTSYGNPGSAVEAAIRRGKDPKKLAALRSQLDAIPSLKDMSIYQTKKSEIPHDLPKELKDRVEKKKFK
jgi:hypothetical protein